MCNRIKATTRHSSLRKQRFTITKYDEHDWGELPEDPKAAAKVLGYTGSMWDNDKTPGICEKAWKDLTAEQKKAASVLGYSQEGWDDDSSSDSEDEERPFTSSGWSRASFCTSLLAVLATISTSGTFENRVVAATFLGLLAQISFVANVSFCDAASTNQQLRKQYRRTMDIHDTRDYEHAFYGVIRPRKKSALEITLFDEEDPDNELLWRAVHGGSSMDHHKQKRTKPPTEAPVAAPEVVDTSPSEDSDENDSDPTLTPSTEDTPEDAAPSVDTGDGDGNNDSSNPSTAPTDGSGNNSSSAPTDGTESTIISSAPTPATGSSETERPSPPSQDNLPTNSQNAQTLQPTTLQGEGEPVDADQPPGMSKNAIITASVVGGIFVVALLACLGIMGSEYKKNRAAAAST